MSGDPSSNFSRESQEEDGACTIKKLQRASPRPELRPGSCRPQRPIFLEGTDDQLIENPRFLHAQVLNFLVLKCQQPFRPLKSAVCAQTEGEWSGAHHLWREMVYTKVTHQAPKNQAHNRAFLHRAEHLRNITGSGRSVDFGSVPEASMITRCEFSTPQPANLGTPAVDLVGDAPLHER